jgi:DnaA regulatory inactivator Hda
MALVQLAFDISSNPVYRWENYYISPSNSEAVTWIRKWPVWPNRVIGIIGEPCSGKTHLVHLWRQKSRATILDLAALSQEDLTQQVIDHPFVIVEDVDLQRDEEKLLHLYNLINEQEGYLVLTSSVPLSQIDITLKDLASRLGSVPTLTINPPDDELLRALLVKRFSDRQLKVPEKVIDYLMKHMERSYSAVDHTCSTLDHKSLQEKRSVTVPFTRSVLLGDAPDAT